MTALAALGTPFFLNQAALGTCLQGGGEGQSFVQGSETPMLHCVLRHGLADFKH